VHLVQAPHAGHIAVRPHSVQTRRMPTASIPHLHRMDEAPGGSVAGHFLTGAGAMPYAGGSAVIDSPPSTGIRWFPQQKYLKASC
jgi:hypothetical protein